MSATSSSRPHRPGRYADLTAFIDAAGGAVPDSPAEIAAATAAALVSAGRSESGSDFVDLADRVGLETLAALWREADPVSLPGVLWALYVLRQWCRRQPDEVARLWRLGQVHRPADVVVAGLADFIDAESVERVVDAVLRGAYRGEFDVALERAAAVFRIVAAGRREQAGDGAGEAELQRAARNERVAADLASAAAKWRAGTLA